MSDKITSAGCCDCALGRPCDVHPKREAFTSNQEVGATRYKLTTGHSDDAGLGGEGWVVRMSDHYPSFDTAQKWVKAEDYEALRLRFEKACSRVTELESRGETIAPHWPRRSDTCSLCGGVWIASGRHHIEHTCILSETAPVRRCPVHELDPSFGCAECARIHLDSQSKKPPLRPQLPTCAHGATAEEACPECLGVPSNNPNDEFAQKTT